MHPSGALSGAQALAGSLLYLAIFGLLLIARVSRSRRRRPVATRRTIVYKPSLRAGSDTVAAPRSIGRFPGLVGAGIVLFVSLVVGVVLALAIAPRVAAGSDSPRTVSDMAAASPSPSPSSATATGSAATTTVQTAPGPEPAGANGSGYVAGKSTEDPAKENATTIVYANPDGSFTADDFGTVVNYQDPTSHEWRRIQPALVTGADGTTHNAAGPYQETFAGTTSDSALLTIAAGTATATLGMPAGFATTKGTVNGNTVTFPNVEPGVSLQYQSLRGAVEELLTLSAPPTNGDFSITFPLHTNGLTAVQVSSGAIELENSADQPVLTIPTGMMQDASADPTTGLPSSMPITQKLAADGASITVTASGSWLRDPSRVYPIGVDPSIDLDCANGCYDAWAANATAYQNTNFNCTYQGSPINDYADYVGYSGPTFGSSTTFLQNQDSYIVGDYVASATWYGYFDYNANGSTPEPYWLSATGGSTQWTATGLTWNNKPGYIAGDRTSADATTGWSSILITNWIEAWANGTYPNHGLQLDENGETLFHELSGDCGSNPSYIAVTYYTKPAAPTGVSAHSLITTDSDARFQVSWTAPPATGTPITSYTVTPYIGTTAGTPVSVTASNAEGVVTSVAVTGLTRGQTYTFQVTATNVAGTGPAGTSPAVTALTAPSYTIHNGSSSYASPVVAAPPVGYNDGATPSDVTVRTLQSGHTPTVVVPNGDGSSISTLPTGPGGRLGSATVSSATTGRLPGHIALADFNGDGIQDAAVVNGDCTIGIMLGNSSGGFGSETVTAAIPDCETNGGGYTCSGLYNVAAGDLNGKVDLVVSGCSADSKNFLSVWVVLGNGNGTFQASTATEYATTDQGIYGTPTNVALADLNGDGKLDMVMSDYAGDGQNGNIYDWLGNGDGTFQTIKTVVSGAGGIGDGGGSSTMAIADINGDGIPDVIITDTGVTSPPPGPGIEVYLGNGDGTFLAGVNVQSSDGTSPSGLAVADINGDGAPDVLTVDYHGIEVYLGTGTNTFDAPVLIPASFGQLGLAVADVNGDGKPDLVLENGQAVGGSVTANVEVLLNGTDFPPIGGPLTAGEMHGCLMCQAEAGGGALAVRSDPITVNDGEFSQTLTDLSIPARGYPISVTQTYNSLNASTDSGLGYGWWSPLFMNVAQNATTGITTVTQEDGAQAQFVTATLAPVAPRIQATLTYSSGGGNDTWTYTRYGGNVFDFNASGQITKISDPEGDYLSFGYTSGEVTSLTHADGRRLSITWASGHISEITDANVSQQTRTVSFTYGTGSHANELTRIDWEVNGAQDTNEQFGYDEITWVHGLNSMTDPDGHVVTQTYNSSGMATSQTVDPSGLDRTTSYTYFTANGQVNAALITDPAGHQEYEQFAFGELVQDTTGLTGCSSTMTGCNTSNEAVTTTAFDPATAGTTLTVDPNGNITTTSYDSHGNVLTTTDPMGNSTVATYTGDGGTDALFNEPTTVQDPNGTVTTYSYDSTYHTLTRVCTPLPGGSCGATPSNAEVISYTHGNSSHPGDVTAMTNGDGKTTNYSYDTYGDQVQVEDPNNNVSATQFDADGRPIASWTPKANCTFNSAPPAGCSSTYKTTISYLDTSGNDDFWGRVRLTTDPLGHTSSETYDADGNVLTSVDGNNNSTTNTYNGAGQLCWTLPGGTSSNGCSLPPTNARVTDYNLDGQVADQKNGLGNQVQSYAYDSRNNVISTTIDAGSSPHIDETTSYTYDANGNLLTESAPGSAVTTYAYNGDNQVCWYLYGTSSNGCASAPSGAVTYTYDPDGQRTGMADATGNWSYTIDALHRLTSVTEAQGGSNSATVGYSYNWRNEVTSIAYPNSVGSVSIGYDNAGRETSVEDWLGNTTAFGYDNNGNLTGTTLPGGSCSGTISLCDAAAFNAADQLTGITDTGASGSSVFGATYGRDNNGQVSSDNSAPAGQGSYGYTSMNQVCYAGSSTGDPCSPPPTGSEAFVYDNADNLTTFGGTTQTFNTADQLTASGSNSYTYDGRGNRISLTPSSGPDTCEVWDTGNHLSEVEQGTGTTCNSATVEGSYLYNGDGLRMSKTVGTTTTTAAWDLSGSLPLQIADGSTYYVYGPEGLPLEQINGSTVLWYHHDQIGSTRAITNSSGTVEATYQFDPYGTILSSTNPGGVSNPFMFQGQYLDSESGLYYLQARYYDPTTAQFLSVDPLLPSTRSPYAYVSGNPLNEVDRAGTDGAGNGAAGAAAAGAGVCATTAEVPIGGEITCGGDALLWGLAGLDALVGIIDLSNVPVTSDAHPNTINGEPPTWCAVESCPVPPWAQTSGCAAAAYGLGILFAHTKNARNSTTNRHQRGRARDAAQKKRSQNLPSNQPPPPTPQPIDPYTDPENPNYEHYPGQYH